MIHAHEKAVGNQNCKAEGSIADGFDPNRGHSQSGKDVGSSSMEIDTANEVAPRKSGVYGCASEHEHNDKKPYPVPSISFCLENCAC